MICDRRYGYYGRWAAAASAVLVAKGAVPVASLAEALWGEDSRPAERTWQPGDMVRVLDEDTRTRWATPHLRVPGYIFGVEVSNKQTHTKKTPKKKHERERDV